MGEPDGAPPIFVPAPEAAASSQLAAFQRFVSAETGQALAGYAALHAFSVEEMDRFWTLFLRWAGVRCEGDPAPALLGRGVEEARFFPGLRLSYVENLLADGPGRGPERLALLAQDERGGELRLDRQGLRGRVL